MELTKTVTTKKSLPTLAVLVLVLLASSSTSTSTAHALVPPYYLVLPLVQVPASSRTSTSLSL
jgi:hypothetical protein